MANIPNKEEYTADKRIRLAAIMDFIRSFYLVKITRLTNDSDISNFCIENSIDSKRLIFKSKSISNIIKESDRNCLYFFRSDSMLNSILFFVDDIAYIMGPFSDISLSTGDVLKIFKKENISNVDVSDYQAYFSSYPLLTGSKAANIVTCMLVNISVDISNIVYIYDKQNDVFQDDMEKRGNYEELLQKRYTYERRFMENIKNGQASQAIQNLHNMTKDVSYLKKIGNTLANERMGAAITRTISRIAALDAGLPPVLTDRISNENTKNIINAKSIDEIIYAKEKLIRTYCSEVNKLKNANRSAITATVIYDIENNFFKNISIGAMAQELNLSLNYIIQTFKKDMGITPARYLIDFRLKKATVLLMSTELTINDVAMAVGFTDANYFIKQFKKSYQKTPLTYRKQMQV